MSSSASLEGIDKQIYKYLDLSDPKSFLLSAGAGSGKTRTLVNVLQSLRKDKIQHFSQSGQRIAIITYTNAACNEIQYRLSYDPIFSVSTIHSFVWELIKPFTKDIKSWLEHALNEDIEKLESKLSRAKNPNSQTTLQNARIKQLKEERLGQLDGIKKFTYAPNSTREDLGTLTHAEVIKIATSFMKECALFRRILVNRFPILLIDESQDTSEELLDAFIFTQDKNNCAFSLGLFGDPMQRIYSAGKENLGKSLPEDWKLPKKKINFRCPKRVVELINSIRLDDPQISKDDAEEGLVRFFIVDATCSQKTETETAIRKKMAEITDDIAWINNDNVKVLILEHAMAANRGCFDKFFMPLSKVSSLKEALLNGTSEVFRFLKEQLLSLAETAEFGNDFEIMRILKKHSTVISASRNNQFSLNPLPFLKKTGESIDELKSIMEEKEPSVRELLEFVQNRSLLVLPDTLSFLLIGGESDPNDDIDKDPAISAWEEAIKAPISHLKNYSLYIDGKLDYGTHQGVKGLEFERVMAILDDANANGFLFSYEKLFSAEQLSDRDISNEAEGVDSVLSRTRRLFYVICSRAQKSLAVVAYTQNPLAIKEYSIESGWFKEEEIEIFPS